jgi:hypothetical protein
VVSVATEQSNYTFMKTLFSLILVFVAMATLAQTKTELPRSEFVLNLSESTLAIKPGESKQIVVSILRSKAFAKSKATLGFSSALPQGITMVYEPTAGNFETSVLTISAEPTMATGNYQVVLNGTVNYKTKGSILKLSVSNENVAAK